MDRLTEKIANHWVSIGVFPNWLIPLTQDGGASDPEPRSSELRAAKGPALRILIVEDEILTADYIHHLLIELGYEVCGHATGAAAALQLTGDRRPDLVLMDVNLGRGGDGVEAARRILEQFSVRSLFVTAYGDRVTLGRAESAQPAGILFKPFDKTRLGEALAAARARMSGN